MGECDCALIERLRRGDTAAFDEIYARFNTRLFTFLVRLSRDRDKAQDLLEDTWLRLVMHADRLRDDTAPGAWLFTVARNLYLSDCRARVLQQSDDTLLNHASDTPSPFESTAAGESQRRLEAALASLPLIYREVLLLVSVGGMTTAEAAAICEVTTDTLRQRLSRGRAMLAERMETATLPGLERREVLP